MQEAEETVTEAMDSFGLMIIEELLRNPTSSYKQIAKRLNLDQRTIARRIEKLEKAGTIRRTLEIDWRTMGMEVSALVGLTTSKSTKASEALHEIMMKDPHVIEVYETLGGNQFFLRILGKDMFSLRDSLLRDLDPLAGELSTSIVTKTMKPKDYLSMVRYLRETRYPRTRANSPRGAGEYQQSI